MTRAPHDQPVALRRVVRQRRPAVLRGHVALLDPAIGATCGIDPGTPWLLMIQLNLLDDGSPIIYSHDYHRGDRFSFDVRRHAEHEAPRA